MGACFGDTTIKARAQYIQVRMQIYLQPYGAGPAFLTCPRSFSSLALLFSDRHERMKWINQVALSRFVAYDPGAGVSEATAASEISADLQTRLSPGEQDILRRVQQLVFRYGTAMAALITGQTEKSLANAASVNTH